MNGQWRGTYTGRNTSGDIIVNVDDMGDHFAGRAYLLPRLPQQYPVVPAVWVRFVTPDKARRSKVSTNEIGFFNIQTATFEPWANARNAYPALTSVPTKAEIKFDWTRNRLSINYSTDNGNSGQAVLAKPGADRPSELKPSEMTWQEFKSHVGQLGGRQYLFRGQNSLKRLRTAYHRTGRADLQRFSAEDMPTLLRHLSGRTRHIYNFAIPDQFGSFLNLVQHHGYPTPLLDWSFSPYVAAFFAYRNLTNKESERFQSKNRRVRVFIFDQKRWHSDHPQLALMSLPFPNFSTLEFMAMDNERMIPQQAVSSISNIDDIEQFIGEREQANNITYLRAIDLPADERRQVIGELIYMGITAGSLFPGLDGACEELRERSFDI